jgi:hypothetical protein
VAQRPTGSKAFEKTMREKVSQKESVKQAGCELERKQCYGKASWKRGWKDGEGTDGLGDGGGLR